jgi:drug/metabolite transporter (DMT)-like permease
MFSRRLASIDAAIVPPARHWGRRRAGALPQFPPRPPAMQPMLWPPAADRDSSGAARVHASAREGSVMPEARSESGHWIDRWLFDQPYVLLSLTSLFWAGNTVLGRFIAGHVPPITLAFIRWGGACVLLLPFAAPHIRRDWPVIRNHVGLMTVLALTGFTAYNTMAYIGLQYTSAINGLLLQSTAPLFIALWAFMLFGERVTPRQAGGVLVSLTGVVVILCRGSLDVLFAIAFNRGDIWFLVALVIYAYYTAALRGRPRMHPLSFLAVAMGWGAVLLTPFVAWEIAWSGRTPVFDAETFATFAYVCIFPSLLGYLFLHRGIELIGANRAAPFVHLVPVFGSVLAIVLLGEPLQLYQAIGYALVFAGITVATRK